MSWAIQLPTTGFIAFLHIKDNAAVTNENTITILNVVNYEVTLVIDHTYNIL